MNHEKITQVISLMRLNKPIGILLLLWPTCWALWLAGKGRPDLWIVGIFVLGVILMRSAGCIINDIADRKIDGHVERTRLRPLPMGKVTTQEALILFFFLISCAFLLVLQLNNFTVLLSVLGALLAVIYPFLKRVTHLPQLGLGVAFAWSVPMAFAALKNAVPFNAWILFLAAAIWPIIYDTMYAIVDRADDIKIGVKSTAILFGEFDKFIIGLLQICLLLVLVWVGLLFRLKAIYYFSVVCAGILFVYQQILIKENDREKCFKAFLNNHWVGLTIFLGILLNENYC